MKVQRKSQEPKPSLGGAIEKNKRSPVTVANLSLFTPIMKSIDQIRCLLSLDDDILLDLVTSIFFIIQLFTEHLLCIR